MKVEIDTDELLKILRTGYDPNRAESNNPLIRYYHEGRRHATLHLSGMLGVMLSFKVDTETFRDLIYEDRLFPAKEQKVA